MADPERKYTTVLIAGGQSRESIDPTIIETVRDEVLRKRLRGFLQAGRIEWLCAMPAAMAADRIGREDFGMTTRTAGMLYRFVVANEMLTFEEEILGRRKIPHFTPRGLLAYVGVVSEDAKGAPREELFQETKAALGNELGRELREIPNNRIWPRGENVLLERAEMLLGQRSAYLRGIPEFTPGQLGILAQTTPQQFSDWLQTIPGTNFDTVTIPPDIFPAASTVLLLVAARRCVQTGTYSALRKFDPSLLEVNKQELRYGVKLADAIFFKNHPERRDFLQLHRSLMLWFDKIAVQKIKWREE